MAQGTDVMDKPSAATGGQGQGSAHGQTSGGGGHKKHSGPHEAHEEAHEGAPEWLISFADNVVLQMGFFVILLALATTAAKGTGSTEGQQSEGGPTSEQLDLALAIREAFNNPVDIGSSDPRDWMLVRRLRMRAMGQSDATQEGLMGREHDVQAIRRSQVYGAGGAMYFENGSSELTAEATVALKELAEHFRGSRTQLELRGHCSAAEAFGLEDRGMQLSFDRAFVVAKGLAAEGIEWSRLRITSLADNDRINATAYDEVGQRANRRVELVQIGEAPR